MKKAFIILGNGFTIDFLYKFQEFDSSFVDKIDVRNLFRLGDRINTPWEEKPGFLSFKNCPALWTLGARPGSTAEECTALIEEIITCANMFFDFVNDPEQKAKRLDLATSGDERLYLKAYSELIVYLRHLFACYNETVEDDQITKFLSDSNIKWGWLDFFKKIGSNDYDKITFVTYNYDVWLERILSSLGIKFNIVGFDTSPDCCVDIIKPHGSISFIPKSDIASSYGINYKLDLDGITIDKLKLDYKGLTKYDRGAIIPPAGESQRLATTAPWSHVLRERAKKAALEIKDNDEIVLCGISYWHVDRRELDELLINLTQNANFTFINPHPPRDLNAVLISIFSKYVQQSTSSEIGGILNG